MSDEHILKHGDQLKQMPGESAEDAEAYDEIARIAAGRGVLMNADLGFGLVVEGKPNEDCDSCDGGGFVYEHTPTDEVAAAIEENLCSQGVPLGKAGTH